MHVKCYNEGQKKENPYVAHRSHLCPTFPPPPPLFILASIYEYKQYICTKKNYPFCISCDGLEFYCTPAW